MKNKTDNIMKKGENMQCITYASLYPTRDHRVGIFNFGTDRVRVLQKTSGLGSGTDRVRVLAPHFLWIGYYRVLKILIGYFLVTSLIRYFLLVQLRSSTLDPSIHLARAYIGFNEILGWRSWRAEENLANKSKVLLKNQIEYLIFWLGFITNSKHCIFRF